MTEPTTNKILDDLLKEIEPYAPNLGLYPLTVGQALGIAFQAAIRAKETGQKSQANLSRWMIANVIQNQPEMRPIIEKYNSIITQQQEKPIQ